MMNTSRPIAAILLANLLVLPAYSDTLSLGTNNQWKVTSTSPVGNWASDASYDDSTWDMADDVTSAVIGPLTGVTYIWNGSVSNNINNVWFRTTFNLGTVPIDTASIYGSVDDDAIVYVNGEVAYSDSNGYANLIGPVDISSHLHSGLNAIGVYARDSGGIHALGLNVDIVTAPIPEPETYALMVAGLGLVGFAARWRKSAF